LQVAIKNDKNQAIMATRTKRKSIQFNKYAFLTIFDCILQKIASLLDLLENQKKVKYAGNE